MMDYTTTIGNDGTTGVSVYYCHKCGMQYVGVHVCPSAHGTCPTCGKCRCCNA